MASINTRTLTDGTPVHRVIWRQGGKQKSLSFTDIVGAERFRQDVEKHGPAEALALLDLVDEDREQTVSQWCTEYVDALSGVTDGTRKQYRRYIAADLGNLASKPLSTITEPAVSAWIQHMQTPDEDGKKPSSKTIQNKHAFLSGAMKAAVRAGKIDRNPCENQKILRTEKREMVMLSRAEFDLIHDKIARPLWADLALWLVSTGMRFGEATALTPDDIDWDQSLCRITRSWKRGNGGWEIGTTKTRRSIRTINVPKIAMDAAVRCASDGGDYLFVNSALSPVRQQNFFNEAWEPARKVLLDDRGKGKVPRIHDLRHTCASWMIGAGVPLVVVSRHLGHESIETTASVYSHVDRRSFAEAAAAIDNMLSDA